MNGYVKIHRELCNHSLWLAEKFTRGQAWVDLILLANAKEGIIIKRDIPIFLKRGQVGRSMTTLGDRWKWSRGKVRTFLKLLEKLKMVELDINFTSCTITIVNYDYWQSNDWQVKRDNSSNNNENSKEESINGKTTIKQHNDRNQDTNNKEKKDNKKKGGIETLTLDELNKLQAKYPRIIIQNSYQMFVNYYSAKGEKFVNELSAFENWVLRDIEFGKHPREIVKFYKHICPNCGDKSTIQVTESKYNRKSCEICDEWKKPVRMKEKEIIDFLQRQKSRISETDNGA